MILCILATGMWDDGQRNGHSDPILVLTLSVAPETYLYTQPVLMKEINGTVDRKMKSFKKSGCRNMMMSSNVNMGIASRDASEERGDGMGHTWSCAWFQPIKYQEPEYYSRKKDDLMPFKEYRNAAER